MFYYVLYICLAVFSLGDLPDSINQFAVSLLKSQNADENIVISPLSLLICLIITHRALDNATGDILSNILFIENFGNNIHESVRQLSDRIQSGEQPVARIANKISVANSLSISDEFTNDMKRFYGDVIAEENFLGDPEMSRENLNQWVSRKTDGKIRNLLTSQEITSETLVVFINAIYFKALWGNMFDSKLTALAPFTLSNGTIVNVDTMQRLDSYYYNDDSQNSCEVIRISYKRDEYEMMIILPNRGIQLSNFIANLSSHKLERWSTNITKERIALHIPKFTVKKKMDVDSFLTNNGAGALIGANLSRLTTNGGAVISSIVHEAVIEVDEEGTEAAAATAVVGVRSVQIPIPEVKINRPFIFIINHVETHTPLFVGKVLRPIPKDELISNNCGPCGAPDTQLEPLDSNYIKRCEGLTENRRLEASEPQIETEGDFGLDVDHKERRLSLEWTAEPVQQINRSSEIDNLTASTAVISFGVDLMNKILSNQNNIILSPYSLFVGLGMLHEGACGEAKQQLRNLLNIENVSDYQISFMISQYNKTDKVTVANQMYIDINDKLEAKFKKNVEMNYFASVQNIDFEAENAIASINQCIAEKTQNKIRSVISDNDVDVKTRILLINAVHFKDTWKIQFEKTFTTNRSFYVSSDNTVSVPTMVNTEDYKIYSDSNYGVKVLHLPYESDFTLSIVLPDSGNDIGALQDITPEKLREWNNGSISRTEIYVPKFSITSDVEMSTIMKSLGAAFLFSSDANFKAISNMNPCLSSMKHLGMVEIDETGTTASELPLFSLRARPNILSVFDINKPFIFYIADRNGTLFFIGKIVNPSAT